MRIGNIVNNFKESMNLTKIITTFIYYFLMFLIMYIAIKAPNNVCEYMQNTAGYSPEYLKLKVLILYLDDNPTALLNALNSAWRWDIIDLFINDPNTIAHWKTANNLWVDACNITGLNLYKFPISFYVWIQGFMILVNAMSVTPDQPSSTLIGDNRIGIIINDIFYKLLWIMSKGYIAYNIDLFHLYLKSLDIFITKITSYILLEIHTGIVSPEFVDLLLKIFEI